MKILEAGTKRFLLIDTAEVDRNYQRRAARGAVALVAEVDPERPGAFIYHKGFGLLTDGPVALEYIPTGKVAVYAPGYRMRRQDVRAAYATTGRIAISESVDEALGLAEPPPAASTTTRPSAKKPAVKKSEEDNQ